MKYAKPESREPRHDADLVALRALIVGAANDSVRLPLLTGSMAPTLLPGDMLLVRPASGRRVHAGDIAVFLRDGKVTAHRIIFALRFFAWSFLLEMGDANATAEPLDQKSILGIVDSFERGDIRMPLARGALDPQARRAARIQLGRFATSILHVRFIAKALGK